MAKPDDNKPLALTETNIRKLSSGTITGAGAYKGLRFVRKKGQPGKFEYRYRMDEQRIGQIKIGDYGAYSLVEAQTAFLALKRMKNEGIDPQNHKKHLKQLAKQEKKQQTLENYTVGQMVEHYLEEKVSKRKLKGQNEARRMFDVDVLPRLKNIHVGKLTRNAVYECVMLIAKRGATRQAQCTVREIKAAIEHAIDAGRIKEMINPANRITIEHNEKPKFVFDDGRLKQLLSWLPSSSLSDNVKRAMLLQLLTGCRGAEVVSAKWDAIDLKAAKWRLDETKTKASVGRSVQLSRQAVALLAEIKLENRSSKYAFPNPRNPNQHIAQKQLSWQLDKHRDECPVQGWTPHDLRRTVRTSLARLNCPSEIAETILGHTLGGVEGVYNLYKYEAQSAEWLQTWADHIDTLREADNLSSITEAQ